MVARDALVFNVDVMVATFLLQVRLPIRYPGWTTVS